MADKEIHYEVIWGQKARVKLAEMKPYKIVLNLVFGKLSRTNIR